MTWLHIGEIIRTNAKKYPEKLAVKDLNRSLTFKVYDERTNRLATGLLKRGLRKGDKIAVLMNNRAEFMEIYAAAAKAGLIIVFVERSTVICFFVDSGKSAYSSFVTI